MLPYPALPVSPFAFNPLPSIANEPDLNVVLKATPRRKYTSNTIVEVTDTLNNKSQKFETNAKGVMVLYGNNSPRASPKPSPPRCSPKQHLAHTSQRMTGEEPVAMQFVFASPLDSHLNSVVTPYKAALTQFSKVKTLTVNAGNPLLSTSVVKSTDGHNYTQTHTQNQNQNQPQNPTHRRGPTLSLQRFNHAIGQSTPVSLYPRPNAVAGSASAVQRRGVSNAPPQRPWSDMPQTGPTATTYTPNNPLHSPKGPLLLGRTVADSPMDWHVGPGHYDLPSQSLALALPATGEATLAGLPSSIHPLVTAPPLGTFSKTGRFGVDKKSGGVTSELFQTISLSKPVDHYLTKAVPAPDLARTTGHTGSQVAHCYSQVSKKKRNVKPRKTAGLSFTTTQSSVVHGKTNTFSHLSSQDLSDDEEVDDDLRRLELQLVERADFHDKKEKQWRRSLALKSTASEALLNIQGVDRRLEGKDERDSESKTPRPSHGHGMSNIDYGLIGPSTQSVQQQMASMSARDTRMLAKEVNSAQQDVLQTRTVIAHSTQHATAFGRNCVKVDVGKTTFVRSKQERAIERAKLKRMYDSRLAGEQRKEQERKLRREREMNNTRRTTMLAETSHNAKKLEVQKHWSPVD